VIPKIPQEVVNVFNRELRKEGPKYLSDVLKEVEKEQPNLFWELKQAAKVLVKKYGENASEGALRLAMIVYRLVEIELEISELEK
jgi:hypothetical protein